MSEEDAMAEKPKWWDAAMSPLLQRLEALEEAQKKPSSREEEVEEDGVDYTNDYFDQDEAKLKQQDEQHREWQHQEENEFREWECQQEEQAKERR